MVKSQAKRSKSDLGKQFLVDSNRPIYRYLSFFQLVDMLERKKLYLQKVCCWDDPFEGSGYIYQEQDRVVKLGFDANIVKNDDKFKDLGKKQFPFGTSWSLLIESDAMWRIYSRDKMGVQIRTSVEKLENALSRVEFPKEYLEVENYFDIKYAVGKVDYNQAYNLNDLEHFLIKKEAFIHEEEIRGLVKFSVTDDRQRWANFDMLSGIKINCFFGTNYPDWVLQCREEVNIIYTSMEDDFIEAVRIDPKADDWIVQTIKSYCESKNITNVKKSDLYGK